MSTPIRRRPPDLSYDAEGRSTADLDLLRIVGEYRRWSADARRTRWEQNRLNWEFYHGRQDFSGKAPGQSAEFLPDFPLAVEQQAAVCERAIVENEDWFAVDPVGLGTPLIDPGTCRRLLAHYLDRLWQPGNAADRAYSVATLVADLVKLGLLEGEFILKVMSLVRERPAFRLERGLRLAPDPTTGQPVEVLHEELIEDTAQDFRLWIDLVPFEDYFPDPTGHGRYDLHEVNRLVHELRANAGYDEAAIGRLAEVTVRAQADTIKRERGGHDLADGAQAGVVRVRECWGDFLDSRDGRVVAVNQVVTTGAAESGTSELLRVMDNPRWTKRRPFVRGTLIRVPLSPVHKALADHAIPMARTRNELWNLLVDAGFEDVWGTRQVRLDQVKNKDEVTQGIPQGWTAVLAPNAPTGYKAVEKLSTGTAPAYGYQMFEKAGEALQLATATNDLRLGRLPPRQAGTTATAAVLADQAATGLFDAIAAHEEATGIAPMLELCWEELWQWLEAIEEPEVLAILGPERAQVLFELSPKARFALLAQAVRFRVTGLRGITQRPREAQRLLTFLQQLQDPDVRAEFTRRYSFGRLLGRTMRALQIDPTDLELTPEEVAAQQADAQARAQRPALAVAAPGGAGPGGGPPGRAPGRAPAAAMPAEAGVGEEGMVEPNESGDRGLQVGGEALA